MQHREYVAGDDLRRIDWKVWSKTDKYYIKQYEEETNLRTTLVVDVSESMQFGSSETAPSTSTPAAIAGRAGVSAACGSRTRSGWSRSTPRCAHIVPTAQQAEPSERHLCARSTPQNPPQKTDMYDILRRSPTSRRSRGLIVLVSDLLVPRDGAVQGAEDCCGTAATT